MDREGPTVAVADAELGRDPERAQSFGSAAIRPWLLIPATVVSVTLPAFNFVGDELRDAARPYKQ